MRDEDLDNIFERPTQQDPSLEYRVYGVPTMHEAPHMTTPNVLSLAASEHQLTFSLVPRQDPNNPDSEADHVPDWILNLLGATLLNPFPGSDELLIDLSLDPLGPGPDACQTVSRP